MPRAPHPFVLLVCLALPGVCGPVAATAQDETRSVVRGRVVDAETEAPLSGAIVLPILTAAGYVTDSLGRFELEVVRDPAGYLLSVEQLGYRTIEVRLGGTATEEFTTIRLPPNPIALEGLSVLVDRFERRRRFFNGPVRVLDQARLVRSPGTAYDVVRRAIPFVRPCPEAFDDLCTYRRGGRARLSICIDERPVYAGASQLDEYDPAELYLVEIFDGSQVRAYTRWFVDRAMREGRRLQPLSWGCT